jgi:lipoprotein-anchoring transpeptidase ErfK/SrfK
MGRAFHEVFVGWRLGHCSRIGHVVLSTRRPLPTSWCNRQILAAMSVSVNGTALHLAGVHRRSCYGRPSGTFAPQMMARRWFSKKYYNSPMPHSIFFYHGFAIHGTNDLGRLGGPASHGCVRLHPSHAQRSTRWSSASAAAAPGSRSTSFAVKVRPKPAVPPPFSV